ncbi:MAG: adenosine deaminase [Steroidobacteraceae bacterium]
MTSIEAFIRGLPKAELHLHIEGTLEPELAFELARKNGVVLPYAGVEQLRRAYQFTNLQSFLDLYYAATDVLRTAEDFERLTGAYLQRAHADGLVHVELFFDPQVHTARGVKLGTVLSGITAALEAAERSLGISHRLIACFIRNLGPDSAMQTLEALLAHRSVIDGVGLDSTECGYPPALFTAVFARARQAGLHVVAHAGEEAPAAYIVEALDLLKVQRIDHGVRCEEDPALVQRLARLRMPLTVCPLSNVRLKVFDRIESHNLRRLLDAGLCVTVNSDDPAYFGGYVAENYLAVQQGLALSVEQIRQLARNSFEGSFLDAAGRQRWMSTVDRYAAPVRT